jgi:hypothetical protein
MGRRGVSQSQRPAAGAGAGMKVETGRSAGARKIRGKRIFFRLFGRWYATISRLVRIWAPAGFSRYGSSGSPRGESMCSRKSRWTVDDRGSFGWKGRCRKHRFSWNQGSGSGGLSMRASASLKIGRSCVEVYPRLHRRRKRFRTEVCWSRQ